MVDVLRYFIVLISHLSYLFALVFGLCHVLCLKWSFLFVSLVLWWKFCLKLASDFLNLPFYYDLSSHRWVGYLCREIHIFSNCRLVIVSSHLFIKSWYIHTNQYHFNCFNRVYQVQYCLSCSIVYDYACITILYP